MVGYILLEVIRTLQVKIELDVSLPGYPNDFHVIPGLGMSFYYCLILLLYLPPLS